MKGQNFCVILHFTRIIVAVDGREFEASGVGGGPHVVRKQRTDLIFTSLTLFRISLFFPRLSPSLG